MGGEGDGMNDAAILERFLREVSGTCEVCGCHGDSCTLREGGRCVWMNSLRTLCNNPNCVIQAARQKKKYNRGARQRGWAA